MNAMWNAAYDNFQRRVMPLLERYGIVIGEEAVFDESAALIVNTYKQLFRSFDPATAILLERRLSTWMASKGLKNEVNNNGLDTACIPTSLCNPGSIQ